VREREGGRERERERKKENGRVRRNERKKKRARGERADVVMMGIDLVRV
jgi:hypothetical protein